MLGFVSAFSGSSAAALASSKRICPTSSKMVSKPISKSTSRSKSTTVLAMKKPSFPLNESMDEKAILDMLQDDDIQKKLILATFLSLPLVLYSEFNVLFYGCWHAPKQWYVGTLESVSYFVLLSIVTLSALHKWLTGNGLPAGPAKLLGAAEGGAYAATAGLALVMLHFYFAGGFAAICSAS